MSERLSLPGFSRRSPADSTAVLPATHEKPRPRHSKLRLALAGVGTFLVAAALLLEFYIAPQLIAWPVSFNQTDTLTATNASYYNAGSLTTKQSAGLTYTLTIRSDAASSSHTTAVWESSAVLMDPVTKYTVNVVTQRAAFNRRTGQLSNCCGASLNGDTRVRQTGLGVVADVDLKMTPTTTVHQLTSLASKNATSITLLQVIAPVTAGVIGLILLALALVPFFRRRMPEPADDGLGLVSDSMQRQDASAANGAVAHEDRDTPAESAVARDGQDASPAESAVSPAGHDASPANGGRPRENEEASKAGAAMTRESEDRQD